MNIAKLAFVSLLVACVLITTWLTLLTDDGGLGGLGLTVAAFIFTPVAAGIYYILFSKYYKRGTKKLKRMVVFVILVAPIVISLNFPIVLLSISSFKIAYTTSRYEPKISIDERLEQYHDPNSDNGVSHEYIYTMEIDSIPDGGPAEAYITIIPGNTETNMNRSLSYGSDVIFLRHDRSTYEGQMSVKRVNGIPEGMDRAMIVVRIYGSDITKNIVIPSSLESWNEL